MIYLKQLTKQHDVQHPRPPHPHPQTHNYEKKQQKEKLDIWCHLIYHWERNFELLTNTLHAF